VRTSLKTAVSMGLLASGVVAQNRPGRLPELPPPKLIAWKNSNMLLAPTLSPFWVER